MSAAPAAKDDIWDDSKIKRTGDGGSTETAADFFHNQDLYKQRAAAGGQRPAPESPKPATPSAPRPAAPRPTPSASRPAAPRPATPSAGSSSNPMLNSPDGPAPKMTNPTDNPMASMAAARNADRAADNRTNLDPRNRLARPTKPTMSIRESLNDAITKILKG